MKKIFTFLAVAAIAASCTTEPEATIVPDNTPNDGAHPTLYATTEGFDNATKAYFDGADGKTKWHAGDEIAVFMPGITTRYKVDRYVFGGADGATSGTFAYSRKGLQGDGFLDALTGNIAIYPHSSLTTYQTVESTPVFTTPYNGQTYAAGSFDKSRAWMYAQTSSLDDYNLNFKYTGGFLVLKLYNSTATVDAPTKIKSIELKSTVDGAIETESYIKISDGTRHSALSTGNAITLNCGDEGVVIGNTEGTATEFWFSLPATTIAGGVTVTATDVDGRTYVKTTANDLVISRAKTLKMAPLDMNATFISSRTIFYEAAQKIYVTATNFGNSTTVVNEYDATTKKGKLIFDQDVTELKTRAFNNGYSSYLTSVTLPDCVATIGDNAFWECSSLTAISLPDNVTTIGKSCFNKCSSLTTITIPDNVTSIGNHAFANCANLESVTLPQNASYTTMADNLFEGCVKLASVTIPANVTTLGNYVFSGCTAFTSFSVPNTVTTIGTHLFYGCTSLVSATFPNHITKINDGTFNRCKSLTSYTIPATITEIGNYAFASSGLTSIVIPDTVEKLSEYMLAYCTELVSATVTANSKVSYLPSYFFAECSKLSTVTMSANIKQYSLYCFLRCTALASKIADILREGIVFIGEAAFAEMGLSGVINLPSTFTGQYRAFSGNYGITSFTGTYASADGLYFSSWGTLHCYALGNPATEFIVPEGITKLEADSFSRAANLTKITLHAQVKEIGNCCFENASKLKDIYIYAETPPSVFGSFGGNAAGLTFHVPADAVYTYQRADEYKNYTIVAIE